MLSSIEEIILNWKSFIETKRSDPNWSEQSYGLLVESILKAISKIIIKFNSLSKVLYL